MSPEDIKWLADTAVRLHRTHAMQGLLYDEEVSKLMTLQIEANKAVSK